MIHRIGRHHRGEGVALFAIDLVIGVAVQAIGVDLRIGNADLIRRSAVREENILQVIPGTIIPDITGGGKQVAGVLLQNQVRQIKIPGLIGSDCTILLIESLHQSSIIRASPHIIQRHDSKSGGAAGILVSHEEQIRAVDTVNIIPVVNRVQRADISFLVTIQQAGRVEQDALRIVCCQRDQIDLIVFLSEDKKALIGSQGSSQRISSNNGNAAFAVGAQTDSFMLLTIDRHVIDVSTIAANSILIDLQAGDHDQLLIDLCDIGIIYRRRFCHNDPFAIHNNIDRCAKM